MAPQANAATALQELHGAITPAGSNPEGAGMVAGDFNHTELKTTVTTNKLTSKPETKVFSTKFTISALWFIRPHLTGNDSTLQKRPKRCSQNQKPWLDRKCTLSAQGMRCCLQEHLEQTEEVHQRMPSAGTSNGLRRTLKKSTPGASLEVLKL